MWRDLRRRSALIVGGVAVVGAAIVFSRRPDAVLHPQYWAEDGRIWYQEAYNDGALHVLFRAHTGYLQTIPRLVASLALWFPFAWGPAIFNVFAFVIQLAPAVFLVTERCSSIIPERRLRVLLALLYLAIPNSFEVHVNMTNAQWHLALLAALVVVARPSARIAWRVFDVVTILICGVSGPFVFVLLPVAIGMYIWRRAGWRLVPVGVFALTAVVQAYNAVAFPRIAAGPLGVSVKHFSMIMGGQVFLGALIGQNEMGQHYPNPHWDEASIVVTAGGLVFVALALLRVSLELRLFVAFAAGMTAAALVFPLPGTPPMTAWQELTIPGVGGRYFLIPMVAWVALLVAVLQVWRRRRDVLSKLLAVGSVLALLVMITVGIRQDWRYPAFPDQHWQHYATAFERAKPGALVVIPIDPPGWQMYLLRK